MQRPLTLQIDNPRLPILKEAVLSESMIEVAPDFTADDLGASYGSGDDSALPYLPPSTINPFKMLRRNGAALVIQDPSESLQAAVSAQARSLHHSLAWLRVALVVQQRGRAMPIAKTFILRPRSLAILLPDATGAIGFRSDLSGHEILEEIEAIEVDFPGCFRIVH